MLTIVIFDDNVESAAAQVRAVEAALPQGVEHVILEAHTRSELAAAITMRGPIDILLADVTMPDGEPSGIEVVRQLVAPGSGTQVIFVSGYLEQATEVYAAPHLYFLLKPIDPDKLRDALDKALAAVGNHRPTMLRIKSGRKERLINVQSITYVESSLHKVIVHTREDAFETYARLDEIATSLPTGFTRCHRSFLVSLAQIRSLETDTLTLHDGTSIPVSRRRLRQTQRDLLAYLAQHA